MPHSHRDETVLGPVIAPAPVRSLLLVASCFAAYLCFSDKTWEGRLSPPLVFSVALLSAIASFVPTLPVCGVLAGLSAFAPAFYALDYIHGSCGYEALTRWDQRWMGWRRQSQLEWYKECIQASQGFYVLLLVAALWLGVFAWDLYRLARRRYGGVRIHGGEEANLPPLSAASHADDDATRIRF